MRKLHYRQVAVKDFLRARNWTGEPAPPPDPAASVVVGRRPRMAMVSSGPPGVGKTRVALNHLATREASGRLLSPSHGQADERMSEAKFLTNRAYHDRQEGLDPTGVHPEVLALYQIGENNRRPKPDMSLDPVKRAARRAKQAEEASWPKYPKHIQGLGRQCYYIEEDRWRERGWKFSDVACSGCDRRQICPSQTQFWQSHSVGLGVHGMAEYHNPDEARAAAEATVIDELPAPVQVSIFEMNELVSLCNPCWHSDVEAWRRPIEDDWRVVMKEFRWLAERDRLNAKTFGQEVQIAGLFPLGHELRHAIERAMVYLEAFPLPAPDPRGVRMGTITPDQWPRANYLEILQAAVDEIDGVSLRDRAKRSPNGVVRTLAIRAFGDKGKVSRVQVELRSAWIAPDANITLLASLGRDNLRIAKRMFPNHDIRSYIREVALPEKGFELFHSDTYALAMTRVLQPSGNVKPRGATALTRAIRRIVVQAERVRESRPTPWHPLAKRLRLKIGIITHRAFLKAMGFEPEPGAAIEVGRGYVRKHKAATPKLERAVQRLLATGDLVLGYRGATIGSNKFSSCRLLTVLGDPTGNIGMLREDARTLGEDANWYIDWHTRTAATQEVFRIRPLDASPTNPKTVLYIGAHPPNLAQASKEGPGMVHEWKKWKWAAGGQLPSEAQFEAECHFWAAIGQGHSILETAFVELLDLLPPSPGAMGKPGADGALGPTGSMGDRLHATAMETSIYALREFVGAVGNLTQSNREAYRRAVKAACAPNGYRRFRLKHPVDNRQCVAIWAKDYDAAVAFAKQLSVAWDQLAARKREAIIAAMPERVAVEETAEAMLDRVDLIREEVTELCAVRHRLETEIPLQDQEDRWGPDELDGTAQDDLDPLWRGNDDDLEPAPERDPLDEDEVAKRKAARRAINAQIKQALKPWRELRKAWFGGRQTKQSRINYFLAKAAQAEAAQASPQRPPDTPPTMQALLRKEGFLKKGP